MKGNDRRSRPQLQGEASPDNAPRSHTPQLGEKVAPHARLYDVGEPHEDERHSERRFNRPDRNFGIHSARYSIRSVEIKVIKEMERDSKERLQFLPCSPRVSIDNGPPPTASTDRREPAAAFLLSPERASSELRRAARRYCQRHPQFPPLATRPVRGICS